ncbi:hypothetical protein BLA29_000261, partial [Euroglyphus maynei]
MHNLVAIQILSEEQQNSLLAYLGFKPSLDSECSWPLHHGVRSLAILAQIILLRQQKEQEDIKCDFNSTTIQIWRGFINKLKQSALSFKGEVAFFNPECPDFQEDLNVEHAQLMLFLFHNLKLLQRKHVFSLVGLSLNEISIKLSSNKCSISAAQILYIGRILHLFEYMCKNLYDTPAYLFEQINHNLLNVNIINNDQMDSIRLPPKSKEDLIKVKLEELQKCPDSFRNIKFFVDKKLDLNYFNHLISDYRNLSSSSLQSTVDNLNNLNLFDFIIHPRFYHLMDVTITTPKSSSLRNFKPKLDGIACNFMLAGFQSLSYDQFYNSLLNLWQFIGYQYDFDSRQTHQSEQDVNQMKLRYPQFGSFGLCAMDYTFGTMWRLMNQLPPSLKHLNDIQSMVDSSMEDELNSFASIDASRILNMCIWLPRFENNRPICQWVSELLSKQGDSNSDGIDTIIKDMVRKFGSLQFNYQLLKCIGWSFFRYIQSSSNEQSSLFKNILLTQQQQLLPLQSYQFPKFFTLFTMDIFLERLIFLFHDEFKKSSKNRNTDDSQMLVDKYLTLMLGLFDKLHQEINAVLLYDDQLSQAGRNNSADMQYLFYRSMMNICSSNSFDSHLSEIAKKIINYLPQAIVLKIDQWDRIYANGDSNVTDQELPILLQKGVLFEPPLIELANRSSTSSSSQSKSKANYLYHLSAFINEKCAIDMPTVTSVDTGDGNITWIKLKQFMIKLFKFIEYIYSQKDYPQQSDPFVTCLMIQSNLVSTSFVSKSSSLNHQTSVTYQILNKLFANQDLTKIDIDPDSYSFILYPYFIGNAFFILSVFNHPLFTELKKSDQLKFVLVEWMKWYSYLSLKLLFKVLFTSLVYLISSTGNFDQEYIPGKPIHGHFRLIHEVMKWLTMIKDQLCNREMLNKIETSLIGNGKQRFLLESSYQMLAYLSDIFNALEYRYVFIKNRKDGSGGEEDNKHKKDDSKIKSSPISSRLFIDDEFDVDVEHSNIIYTDDEMDLDYEDEEDLAGQLCTFTQTAKDFINQHWYHCHTCKMLDGVGVCTVCAKVCHRNHDVTYSKCGSFFCDCGAKEDGSCKALVKRQPNTNDRDKKILKKRSQQQHHHHRAATPTDNNKSNHQSDGKKATFTDKKRALRISKYWYTSFYSLDSHQSKLSDNYKMSRNRFSANPMIVQNYERFGLKYENLDNYSSLFMSYIVPISDTVISLVEFFVPILQNFFDIHSELGYFTNIRKAFDELHCSTKSLSLQKCEQLMVVQKTWHDSFIDMSNDQSHSSRHLSIMSGSIVHCQSMLVIGANAYDNYTWNLSQQQLPSTYPCMLALVHDKNRLSIIHLNQLLGQVYSNSRKKLNPQKIATVSFPFTIMTISNNPMNDKLIAIASLKECHVLTLAPNGAITGHYPLSMSFDNNNHIIKTFWFPDRHTELAVVTLDFIKIYDLSLENRDQPIYNFVITQRKIRDMTFFSYKDRNGETKRFILILSGRGHIYAEELNSKSKCSSSNDVFYVTSILNVSYPKHWNSNNPPTVVGFSIYYSHSLQMLFVSFITGCSFCAPFGIKNIYDQNITNVTLLELQSNPMVATLPDQSTSTSSSSSSQPIQSQQHSLFKWTEVLQHPGLIFALTHTNSPVCFMIESNRIKIQELKPKKKIIDLVAISTQLKDQYQSKITTLLSLCDDGSLRFHRAVQEQTNFWLKPEIHNLDEIPTYYSSIMTKSIGSKSSSRAGSNDPQQSSTSTSNKSNPHFAVDFFERCTLILNDIEFGGSDILEVYNVQQIKNRLNSTNMYIACTKPNGFSITITQTGSFDLVMAGVRVNLGVCDPARAPTSIEVFGRTIWVAVNRHRWFDIPFTRSEMKKLIETNTLSIRFAPSADPNQVTIVDSIRVYGRLRDLVGLPSVTEEETAIANINKTGTSSFDDLRRKLIQSTMQPRSSSMSIKSPIQKLSLLLNAPSITDDELIMAMKSTNQSIIVVNRLMATSLDVLESLISFTKSTSEMNVDQQPRSSSSSSSTMIWIMSARDLCNGQEFKQKCDTALSISSKLLTISLSKRLDKSICMLLAKLLPSRNQYDEHRGDILFENGIENLNHVDDINVYRYYLSWFHENVHEYPKNFIRFILKYFSKNSNDPHTSTLQFCSHLVDLFWRLYLRRPSNDLTSPLTMVGHYYGLELLIDSLVFILHSSTYAITSISGSVDQQNENQQKVINKCSQLVVQMLCSLDPRISFATKKALLRILYSISSGIYRHHMEKQSPNNRTLTPSVSKQPNASSSVNGKSESHRERRHSARHSVGHLHQTTANVSIGHQEPSTSSGGSLLHRQGATRRSRSSGLSSSWWTTTNRPDASSSTSGSGSGRRGQGSGSISGSLSGQRNNTAAASLLER